MSFNAQEDRIRDLLSRRVYSIPRNQRKYVWKKDNWKELFDDVLCVVDGKLNSHFIGSIVLSEKPVKNGLPYYAVIDGQQRTITISIFLASIMFVMKKLGMSSDFNGTKPYVIAKDDKDNDVVIVTAENGESLERIIMAIIDMAEEDAKTKSATALVDSNLVCKSDKNIGDAFKFFISEIISFYEKNDRDKEKILALRDSVRDITFVNITATNEEDSYTIFEILNARGLDLEDHELLKNYIMRYIHPEETRDKAKEDWLRIENKLGSSNMHRFIRHYTTHKYGDQRTKNKSLSDYKLIQNNNKGKNTKDLLDDLQLKAEYYLKLIAPCKKGDDANCSEMEYRVFSFFKRKRQEQMRPLILSLITKNKEGLLDDKLYEKTLNFLYDFYICFNIISEENSNKLTNIVDKYSARINNEYSEQIVLEFVDELRNKLPSREMFRNAFANVGWSHHATIYEGDKNKERVKTVLEVLERHINNGNCCEDMTIEHLIADNKGKENGQIGNLIPLEERINKRCKDKLLKEKLSYYDESSFKTARNIAKRYSDKEFDPKMRTEYMAKLFYDEILKLETL